jgi:hypothetical protein
MREGQVLYTNIKKGYDKITGELKYIIMYISVSKARKLKRKLIVSKLKKSFVGTTYLI